MANKGNPHSEAHSLRQALKALEARFASLGDAGLWAEIDASDALRTKIEASAGEAILALKVMDAVVENLGSLLSEVSHSSKDNEMNFMASSEEAEFIDEYIGSVTANFEKFLSNKILPLSYRKRVYYDYMERGSISKLLATELGLDGDSARKAEDLVREFLKASKGIDLDASEPVSDSIPDEQTLTLPDAPPKYKYSPNMPGGIIKYLKDNWSEYISSGAISMPYLKRVDISAYESLRNWKKKRPQEPLPYGWVIPTKSEAIDRDLARLGGEERIMHLAQAVAGRQRRKSEPK